MAVGTEMKALLDVVEKPSLIVREDYTVAYCNRAFRRKYGSYNLAGRKCHEIVFHDLRCCSACGFECPLEKALVTGDESRAVRREFVPGGENLLEINVTPLNGVDGKVRFFIEVIDDKDASRGLVNREGLVTNSPSVRGIIKQLSRLAQLDTVVLFSGEAGTGKEVFARFLHENSRRAAQPFIKIGCTGLDKEGFENELLGVRFSASEDRTGGLLNELSGTLFLDEIADLNPYLQYKLLNILETGLVRGEGSSIGKVVDFRVMCSTQKDLEAMVRDGNFRADLYYRLKIFEIKVPSLKNRREDIAHLVDMIVSKICGNRVRTFTQEAYAYLRNREWKGNVRELLCLIEKVLIFSDSQVIGVSDLLKYEENDFRLIKETESFKTQFDEGIRKTIEEWQGSRKELANYLGISERTLYRKLGELKSKKA